MKKNWGNLILKAEKNVKLMSKAVVVDPSRSNKMNRNEEKNILI